MVLKRTILLIAVLGTAIQGTEARCDKKLAYFWGDSMEPTIQEGNGVYYEQREKYYNGDIIIYRYDKNDYLAIRGKRPTWIVHRIIAHDKNYYYTKGDNNEYEDIKGTKKESIVGAVCKIRPY